MRIGLLFEYSTINGGENSILAVVDEARSMDVQPVAILNQPGPLEDQFLKLNLPVCRLYESDDRSSKLTNDELSQRLRDVIRLEKLELVHANSMMMSRRLGRISNTLPVPTTGHIRDIMNVSQATIRDLSLNRSLIAVSEAVREHWIAAGIPEHQVQSIYNGIHFDQFAQRTSSNNFRQRYNLPEDAFLVAAIGQICLRKGQDEAVEAFSRIGSRYPKMHFLLVGKRHSQKSETIAYDERLDQIIHEAGLNDRFHRLGFCERIPELLNETDLLVHTARQEPLGRVLLEAAASGVAIIATRVGGTEEILTHNQSAILVEPRDIDQLTEAMSQLYNEPQRRTDLLSAAQSSIQQRFNIADRASETVQFWKDILRNSRDSN
ncbi:GDP-mannose-dependent alpha-(1-6)-phosphatidylinositol monomannoside mannosyltransferase [Thalassoglobus neptunius]|uniref:GDP-mannose-dependent alpha-(1-6)-phosphatidylinositol monomannoside mannosyltransferase n=2 Tax=Thalassoglobus neptunius TaxID=1938619 RepID=A0A5C5VRN0_9PLAN|nr:GDP-mannose-dependent alpha-(1-6)-phosphatidylinositol monomannoside mannosyltransferase [Thalassoglobus neptunius]